MKPGLVFAIFAALGALVFSGATAQAATPPSAEKAPTAAAAAAVPGIAPSDGTGTYLDQQGQVIPPPGKAAQSQFAAASSCTPVSGRDNPHYTAPDVSGHGWWGKGNCTGSTATVYNCLYEFWTDGTWRQQACSAHEKLKPGTGGSSYRTNARVACDSTGQTISWRNHVDVDVNGQSDTGEQPYNQANVNCVVG
jgi:hypothetical protein